jgi:hypothetical protein
VEAEVAFAAKGIELFSQILSEISRAGFGKLVVKHDTEW